jgi:hypothetical protein
MSVVGNSSSKSGWSPRTISRSEGGIGGIYEAGFSMITGNGEAMEVRL